MSNDSSAAQQDPESEYRNRLEVLPRHRIALQTDRWETWSGHSALLGCLGCLRGVDCHNQNQRNLLGLAPRIVAHSFRDRS